MPQRGQVIAVDAQRTVGQRHGIGEPVGRHGRAGRQALEVVAHRVQWRQLQRPLRRGPGLRPLVQEALHHALEQPGQWFNMFFNMLLS